MENFFFQDSYYRNVAGNRIYCLMNKYTYLYQIMHEKGLTDLPLNNEAFCVEFVQEKKILSDRAIFLVSRYFF